MKLSIIIVNWNVKDDLLNCLRSIDKNPPQHEYEVIIVDNASTDNSPQAVREEFPNVHVLENSHNHGFAGANNDGFRASQGQLILFLNPDTIIKPGSLDGLIDFMESNPDVGVCGPKLLFDDGTVQQAVRHFPTFKGALHRHTVFKAFGFFRKAYKEWMMKDFSYSEVADVDQVIGAALMVRREIFDRVGLMDERNFFMYYEEVDLCYRIKQAGWRIVFVPYIEIIHLGGKSSGQVPVKKTIMAMTSLLKYFRKHYGFDASVSFCILFIIAVLLNELAIIFTQTIAFAVGCILLDERTRTRSSKKIKNSLALLARGFCKIVFRR